MAPGPNLLEVQRVHPLGQAVQELCHADDVGWATPVWTETISLCAPLLAVPTLPCWGFAGSSHAWHKIKLQSENVIHLHDNFSESRFCLSSPLPP